VRSAELTIPPATRSGLARQQFYGALAWAPSLGWRGGIDVRALSRVFVNDSNSDAASGFGVVGANVGYQARFGKVDVSGFARSTTCSRATTPAR
jgi:iron complex outermembrane receptor protein